MKPSTLLPLFACVATTVLGQGALTPPGAPAPTMKTLAQVEPRIPISSLPFIITQPGSYYMTTNLTGLAGVNGISVSASGVTVDLMGFELTGMSNSLNGIQVNGARSNIAIHNGTIRNWGSNGAVASQAYNVHIERLATAGNGQSGIRAAGSVIRNCSAFANGRHGIEADVGSTVSDCTAKNNSFSGIQILNGLVKGCVVNNNGGDGIFAATSSVKECIAYANGGDGIHMSISSVTSGCVTFQNHGHGIRVGISAGLGGECLVSGNTCSGNNDLDQAGIWVNGTNNRIEGNNCLNNAIGIAVADGGNLIIKNSCSGNTLNWSIVVGNRVAQIQIANGNPAAINGNSYTGTLGSTDPFANFTY